MKQNAWCTPEYYDCILEEDLTTRPSQEGLPHLVDSRTTLLVYHKILPHHIFTPSMYLQVIPGSVYYLLLPSENEDMVDYMEEEP